MKPAIYLRVSTEMQSLESQRAEVLSYCAYRHWPQPVEFTDVISGSKAARPGLDALFAAIAVGEVDMIVVVKLDRLGRSLKHITQVIAQLEKKKVSLVCTSQGIDTTNMNPMGRMQLGILGVFAEFEREMIRDRTRAGLAAAKARGLVLGKPSAALARVADVPAEIRAWREAGRPGGYRGLARQLGGCSTATAHRLDKETPVGSQRAA